MRILEHITASGRGIWYTEYDVLLTTRTSVWPSRNSGLPHTVTDYWVHFSPPGIDTSDRRQFESELDRSRFLSHSFQHLRLEACDQYRELQHPVATLLNSELEAVTFVQDYIQLQFLKGFLSIFSLPLLRFGTEPITPEDDVYHRQLCALINVPLAHMDEYWCDALLLEFANGVHLEIDLSGYESPDEAAHLAYEFYER